MQACVYGDNFVIKSLRSELYEFLGQLKTHMLAKNNGVLGSDLGDGGGWSVPAGNRLEAIQIEADVNHSESAEFRHGKVSCDFWHQKQLL